MTQNETDLFSIVLNSDWSISVSIHSAIIGVVLIVILAFGIKLLWRFRQASYEIDEAEFGFGNATIKFRPNEADRQVVYSIWVELSTRKIGLPIDFNHDVIAEVYSSWYDFFGITRELIKAVPVQKVKAESTKKIINLSIEVLNFGLRPHLTKWQARFRYWYESRLRQLANESDQMESLDPQTIQRDYPLFDELRADMEAVSEGLIRYRKKLKELVLGG